MEIPYCPEPKQKTFHQSEAKFRCFLGAWRAGKTYSGCIEALKQSLLYKNNFGLIGRKNFTDLRDTTIKTFFELCPEEAIRDYNKTEHHLTLKNGSEILFRELKDGLGLGSLNLGFFYIDEAEQVQESLFERLTGRLSLNTVSRQCGWITSNPPNKDHWIYKRFAEQSINDYEIFYASTYENKQYLPAGYIETLEKMPESWKKKYLLGEFGFTPDGKPFYAGYDERLHKGQFEWNKEKELICGWDYGWNHPACLITQIGNEGRWYILHEIMGAEETIDQFADRVKAQLNLMYPGARYKHYGDPAGKGHNDKSEETSEQVLRSKGINVISKQSTYRERKEIIEPKLATLINGKPALMVDEGCGIINDGLLGGYHYPESKDGKPVVEEPYKDGYYDHLANCLEYIAVNIFSPIKQAGNKDIADYHRQQKHQLAQRRGGYA